MQLLFDKSYDGTNIISKFDNPIFKSTLTNGCSGYRLFVYNDGTIVIRPTGSKEIIQTIELITTNDLQTNKEITSLTIKQKIEL